MSKTIILLFVLVGILLAFCIILTARVNIRQDQEIEELKEKIEIKLEH